jgi:F-type H+-transporting ATPase subunit epsilon
VSTKFNLKVVTPYRNFYEGEVEKIVVQGAEGEMAVLADHIPMVTPLAIGKLVIINDDKKEPATLAGGFMQIADGKVVIVAEAAEWPHEIDVKRAEDAKNRAEGRLKDGGEETDSKRANESLKKARVRLDVAEEKK